MKYSKVKALISCCFVFMWQLSTTAQESNTFEIRGSHPKNGEKVFLMYYAFDGGEKIIDSTQVSDHKFKFSGTIEGPSYGGILLGDTFDNASKNWGVPTNIWFTIFKGTNNLSFGDEKPKNLGGNIGFESEKIYKQILTEKRNLLNSEGFKADLNILTKLMEELKTLDPKLYDDYFEHEKKLTGLAFIPSTKAKAPIEKLKEIQHLHSIMTEKYGRREDLEYRASSDFLTQYPDDEYSLYLVKEYINKSSDYGTTSALYHLLSNQKKNTNVGKKLAHLIGTFKLVIGATAPTFVQKNTLDQDIELSSFKGKYLLIDFWASWCAPCRKENPYLVAAYDKYRKKNFEILGVSLDDNRSKWMTAIQEDNLQWTHVSDLKGWKNDAAILYGIRAVPTNYLIDPTGKIIAKNLRGDQLDKVLSDVLNK